MSKEDKQEKKTSDVETIGKQLHDARMSRGYTIDDLQKLTKIQKRYLIAIEEGDFKSLPGDFYVRAFIKQYADAVGLNGSEVLKNYDTDLPDTQNPDYVNKVSEDKLASRTAKRKVDDRYQAIRRYIPIAVISVVVLVVIIVIWVAAARNRQNTSQTDIHQNSSVTVSSSKNSSKDSSSSSSKKKASSSSSKKKTTKSKKTTTKSSTTAIKSLGNDSYKVSGKAKGADLKLSGAWYLVKENGSTVWQGTVAKGSSHIVKLSGSTTTVEVDMGNAINSSVTVNGKKVPFAKSVSPKNINLKFE